MTKEQQKTDTAINFEKKIGNTTYIVTTTFNGDKNRNLGASLVRMINRDALSGNCLHKISA